MYSSRTDAMRSATAQQALAVSSQNIAILNGMSWSGCDWCCGGGREDMNHYVHYPMKVSCLSSGAMSVDITRQSETQVHVLNAMEVRNGGNRRELQVYPNR